MKKTTIYLTALLLMATLFAACKKERRGPLPDDQTANPTKPPTFAFDNNGNSTLMFQDGDSMDSLTSKWKEFEIGQVLRVKPIDKTTIEVANFAPIEIEDATILMKINGQSQAIKLFKISKIRAHGVQRIKYPFVEGTKLFLDTDDKEVDLAAYQSGIDPKTVGFEFTGTSPLIVKLKKLGELKWKMRFRDFDEKNDPSDNWKDDIQAKDIRLFTGLLINFAYMYTSGTDQKANFMKEEITGNDSMPMTEEKKEEAYKKILDKTAFGVGVCVNVNGLASPSRFAVADYVLGGYLYKGYSTPTHEMGHVIGFSHASTMTYPTSGTSKGKGAVVVTLGIWSPLLVDKNLPVTFVNYYKNTDHSPPKDALVSEAHFKDCLQLR